MEADSHQQTIHRHSHSFIYDTMQYILTEMNIIHVYNQSSDEIACSWYYWHHLNGLEEETWSWWLDMGRKLCCLRIGIVNQVSWSTRRMKDIICTPASWTCSAWILSSEEHDLDIKKHNVSTMNDQPSAIQVRLSLLWQLSINFSACYIRERGLLRNINMSMACIYQLDVGKLCWTEASKYVYH